MGLHGYCLIKGGKSNCYIACVSYMQVTEGGQSAVSPQNTAVAISNSLYLTASTDHRIGVSVLLIGFMV